MLHFILGVAGTGKTERIMENIRAAAEKGERVVYLVPEQYSFEAERQIHRRLGGKLALGVEVLSFTRAANSIFRAYGGLAGVALTKTAKYLLMSIASSEVTDKLTVYRKSVANTAFLETLVQTCGEFKSAGLTPESLSDSTKKLHDEALRNKLDELAVIYSAYQALIARGYNDPDDDLIRACAHLENNAFFEGAHVFVDGFATFMAAEFEFLGHIIGQSREVYFAMTADEVYDNQRGIGVFSAAKSAMARLSRLAANANVNVDEAEILAIPHRFLHSELEYLAKNFMQPAPPPYSGEYSGALRLYSAADAANELDFVASEISRLVREKGFSYNEIAVVARDPSTYSCAIESAFSRHNLPFFMSIAEDIENNPLISCVLAAINAVRSGFDATSTLLFAKSPLLGVDAAEIAVLENYCYCWGVRGALWSSKFGGNPRGFSSVLSEHDVTLLESINITRDTVITPLLNLQTAMKEPNGSSFAKGIFNLLCEINSAENIEVYANTLENSEAFLAESAQMWDALMGILDIFGTALGSYKMTAARMCELFRLAVNAEETASRPQTLDQVLIGGADRIRPDKVRAVFVIGANENVFPAQLSGSGVFSDSERSALIEANIEISAPTLQKSVLEKYFAYISLTLPSEYLSVSFSRSDLKGREMLPSVIVAQIKELFEGLPKVQEDKLAGISTTRSAFDALAKNYRVDTEFAATLREYFTDGHENRVLKLMEQAIERRQHQIMDTTAAKQLFGSFMRLSPSRIERFYKCPFSYFISDGLQIRARSKVEFSGLESGSVMHYVLQVMLQRHGGKGISQLTDKQMNAEIGEIIREYLTDRIDDVNKLPARLRFLFKRLSGMLTRLLRRLGEEFLQSSFEPAAFELPIKLGEKIEPLRLETADGTSVVVEGVVDRVDVMNKGGKRYIRVVDYKSGVKDFALHDVLYGLNMQMLLYLFTIANNGVDELSDAIPAGVLYMPARERFVSAARDSDAAEVQKTREKEWRMSGLLLDDDDALRGMERDIAGVYIPAKLDKYGNFDAASSLASRAELGSLARKVTEQVAQMAEHLANGQIKAYPIEENGCTACEYCDYSAICGRESGDEVKQISKLDREDVFKLLAEEEQDGKALD